MLWIGVSHCEQIRSVIGQATVQWGRSACAAQHSQAVLTAQALGNMLLACEEDARDLVRNLNCAIQDPSDALKLFGVEVQWTKRRFDIPQAAPLEQPPVPTEQERAALWAWAQKAWGP